MHLIRRAALRAASAKPAAIVARSRSINTVSPFVLRSKAQAPIVSVAARRFNSDEVKPEENEEKESESESYASEAIESVKEAATEAYNDAAEVVGAAVGGYGGQRSGSYGDRERAPIPDVDPNPKVYAGNLAFDVTSADLEKLFSEFGNVASVNIIQDSRGLSKGFAYVELESTEAATKAIETKHQTDFLGRRLVVNYARERKPFEERPQNPPSKSLYVGNLAFEMSDSDLNKLFRDVKNVIDVRVAIDRRTGQPRGFAHADFADIESATAGKEILSQQEVYGRKLKLDFSSGVREAPAGGRGGYGGGRGGGGYGGGRGGGGYGGDRGGYGGGRGGGGGYGGDRGGDRGGFQRRDGGGGGYGGDRGGNGGGYGGDRGGSSY